MDSQPVAIFLMGLLMLAPLAGALARRLHLPPAVALLLLGFVASEVVVGLGHDTGVRADNFRDLIVLVLLPVLVFEEALNIKADLLWRNLLPILLLAIPGLLLVTAVTAALVYYGIGHASGFPWLAALLTGTLVAATEPAAVVDVCRKLGAPERLIIYLEGESLLNDAGAIVLFGLFLGMAQAGEQISGLGALPPRFLLVFFGGLLAGLLVGLLGLGLLALLSRDESQALVTLVCAYFSYLLADAWLGVSGVLAVLACGLLMGGLGRRWLDRTGSGFVLRLWRFGAYLGGSLVFLLMGVTVTLAMFEERWLAMLIGIAGVLIARALGVFAIVPWASRLGRGGVMPLAEQRVLYWGGNRGAVTLALALSIPVQLEYWWTVQSIAFGVVLFTLLIQAPTLPPLVRRLLEIP